MTPKLGYHERTMNIEELNEEQQHVVLHGDGPCLVLAGAGSGKTRTITYRVAYLLEQGIDPERILLVTFTNKASKEMMERVSSASGTGMKLPWAGTFHHIAYRILKKYAGLLGYQSNFTILDSADSLDILKLCLKVEGVNRNEKRFPSPKVLQSIISYARNAETTIADVLDLKHPNWLDIADTITRIAEEYRKRKLDANAMDFDDLLVNLYLLLLKEPAVKQKFANQFLYILVDEYQDTNKIQASIINQFAAVHHNVLVVGDDAQSIYSFRAADIQNILDFDAQYPGANIFRLETNYRSTPNILDVANDVIANNTRQHQKTLRSLKEAFMRPEVHAFADDREEAEFIAGQILQFRDEGVPLKHIAVLFRAAFHSQALEMELMKRDIPYDYRGGVRFFERSHIKDVLAYLRIVANKDDVVAWSRVLNMQVGLGPVTVEKIIGAIRQPARPAGG
ncbi:MAG TPA: ATP-dependent DNA helicase, partial [Candidatus Magasanikbacteria bacterium]|nr:ATP-dependent DNA helicase [Candidatus Magasanikbacteria bacterium]